MNKLSKNVLSIISGPKKRKPTDLPNVTITDNLKHALIAIMNGMDYDLTILTEKELIFLNRLIKRANVNVIIPKVYDKNTKVVRDFTESGTTANRLKSQFKVLTGMVIAGNNSHELKVQLKGLVEQMFNKGMLSEAQVNDVIEQFCQY